MKNQNDNQNNVENKRQYTPVDSILMFFLLLLVPYVLAIPVYSFAGAEAKKVLSYIIPQVAIVISFVALSVYRKVNVKKANQINFKLNIWVVLIVVAIGVISIFGLSPIVSVFEQIFTNWGYKNPAELAENKLLIPTVWSLLAKMLYIGLLPAICEEFAVRGVMTNGFKKYGTIVACTFSALMFAFMHGNLSQFVYPIFMGFVMAYIALKTGSIIYTIILHFFNNAIILISTYLNQKNGVPETPIDLTNAWNIILPILFAILTVVAIFGLLYLMKIVLKKQKEKSIQNLSEQQANDANICENLQTEPFFKKPITVEKIVTVVGLVSIFVIWLVEILGRF